MPNIFVTTLDLTLADRLKSDLESQGFSLSNPPHTLFAAHKKGVSCTLYQSGKLVVQGKEMNSFIEFYLEPEVLADFEYTHPKLDLTARIGIDESGKGDFFGPLCVAGVFASGEEIGRLKDLGVRDSKSLSDSAIEKLARQIRSHYAHHIVKINPTKYNELQKQFSNLNKLLAWGHATAIEQLVVETNCHNVIIDQFAAEETVITALRRKKLEVTLTQRHKAESDLVVAAASILARDAFVQGLQQLSDEMGMKLPKGASRQTIEAGRALVRKYGKEIFHKVAKMHFKTLDAILKTDET